MMWLLWALGCAPKDNPAAATSTDGGVERFKVHVQTTVSVEGADQLPLELRSLLGGFQTETDLVIEKSLVRQFRDGSLGYRVHFAEASSGVVRAGEEREPVTMSLAGRTVELRAFPDGELLDVDLVSHVVGPERMMDTLDVVFPAISPAPPASMKGARAFHWPVKLSREQVVRNSVWATWDIEDKQRERLALVYSGGWEATGWERVGEGRMRMDGRGELSGALDVRRSDGQFTRHTLHGARTLAIPYPGASALEQTTRFDVTVERL